MVSFRVIPFLLIICATEGSNCTYYANNTDAVCLEVIPGKTASAEWDILLHENTPLITFFYPGDNTISVVESDSNIEDESIGLIHNTFSFCLKNATFDYAGVYRIDSNKDNTSILYVLGKPDTAIITVEDNGTVNDTPGRLQCSAQSTSMPIGFNFTFLWKVNGFIIKANSQYSFLKGDKSILSILTYRNESQNNYTCKATEKYGQSSDQSLITTINPTRSPIVTIGPIGMEIKTIRSKNESLTCSVVDANPSPSEYQWFKDGKSIEGNTAVLNIVIIQKTQAGKYVCRASNKAGGNNSSAVSLDVLYGPDIHLEPLQSQEEGHNITIECKISSNPVVADNAIEWTRLGDNSFSKRGRSLTLFNLQKNDHGIYNCSARVSFVHSAGSHETNISTASFNLDVLYGPSIVLPTKYDQIENKSINIRCNVSSNPKPIHSDIVWTKDGIPYSTGFILDIHSVKRKDSGTFNCSANITLNVTVGPPVKRFSTKKVEINVLYGPDISLIKVYRQIENRPLNITCHVISNPKPSTNAMKWIRNGAIIEEGPTLSFESVRKHQQGIYSCSVDLMLVPTEGQQDQRLVTDDFDLEILYGPEVANYNAIPVTEGSVLSIFCNVSSNPTATDDNIVWRKEGNTTFEKPGLSFNFSSVDRKDLGLFTCTASIKLISTDGFIEMNNSSGNVNVTVYYQPEILNVTNASVLEGNNTMIRCIVDGNPVPKFSWTYVQNNSVVKETDLKTINTISISSIVLQSARCEDTGTYRCHVDNTIKSPISENVDLTVNCTPRISFIESMNVTIGRNESLNLTVMFHAVPQPSFTWKFNGSALKDFISVSLNYTLPYKFGARLLKTDFEESNIGEYNIIATNKIGSASENVNIIYQREPYEPVIIDLSCREVPETAKLVWKSPGNGGQRQRFKILYRPFGQLDFFEYSAIDESENDNEYTRIVNNLSGNEKYGFKIMAENDVGSIQSQEKTCTILAPVEQSPVLQIVGGVCGGLVGFAVVGVVCFIFRRQRIDKPQVARELIQRRTNDQDDDEGLKDNPLYVQSGPYQASSNADMKGKGNQPTDVKKERKKLKSRKEKKGDDVYENADDLAENQDGHVYGNVNGKTSPATKVLYKPEMNQDGLLYADLEFNPSSSRFVIRGLENKSVYADIDLTRKAEPLPSDSDGDEQNEGSGKAGCKSDHA